MRRIWIALIALLVLTGTAAGAGQKTKLALVAYSTPRESFAKIIPAFQKTNAGRDVDFSQSYGASGEQARAVIAGLDADIVNLSLEPDVSALVRAGVVRRGWNRDRYHGMVTNSLVVFVVRDGNPKKIRGWSDLVRKGIEVITPNPFTSGGARWNVMAAYGAQRKQGRSHKQAVAYLSKLFHHVPVQDKSARDALRTFSQGKGDVLLTYENEAIFANKKGIRTDYVIPRQTILMENPVALTESGLRHKEAKAFLAFLRSSKAQKIFADNGYRPVVSSIVRQFGFKRPPGLFSIRQLGMGGWPRVEKRFFDPRTGIMAKIERSLGR